MKTKTIGLYFSNEIISCCIISDCFKTSMDLSFENFHAPKFKNSLELMEWYGEIILSIIKIHNPRVFFFNESDEVSAINLKTYSYPQGVLQIVLENKKIDFKAFTEFKIRKKGKEILSAEERKIFIENYLGNEITNLINYEKKALFLALFDSH